MDARPYTPSLPIRPIRLAAPAPACRKADSSIPLDRTVPPPLAPGSTSRPAARPTPRPARDTPAIAPSPGPRPAVPGSRFALPAATPP